MRTLNTLADKILSKIPAHVKGNVGESIAAIFLLFKGFTPLAASKSSIAQVDLLMENKNTIILVEVKFRKSLDACHHAISPRQKNALLAQARLMQGNFPKKNIRIDAVFIFTHKPFIQHIPNVWS